MMKKWVAVGMIPISLFLLTYSLLFSTVEKNIAIRCKSE